MAAGNRDVCRSILSNIRVSPRVDVRDDGLPGNIRAGDWYGSQIRSYQSPELS